MAGSPQEIFEQAVALRGLAREEYLSSACGTDEALRAEILALLRIHDRAPRFLASPTGPPAAAATVTAAPREHEGQVIDRYKLLQPIGEGGFGSVWMAEQREPVKRRVALKIIKLGMDTKQVIARFEAERQALALMDHPNIAKVLDAGSTEAGRPYFVMEYIKGVPILEYCDTERLDTRARLDLFTSVCLAIQHAHQKGIIHRDIKPGNVLITMHDGIPVPKVIDFGIAKATSAELTQRTLFTEHRQMIGTPAYMSPEQAEMSGLDIDTRSDVYSLGVLLYELLTGTTPFSESELRSAGFVEMMRIIREVEPHKPSTRLSTLGETATKTAQQRHADVRRLSTILRGDLDWIVMKCLEKDRTRRYETPNSLAIDIRRYLSGEPVLAAPPSTVYQLRKFIRRHRGMVSAGATVAAALLIGLIAFAWQAKIARDQRDVAVQAKKNAQDAQADAGAQRQKAEAERDRAERELSRAEGLVYAGKLMLAQSDFEDGDGGLALHYLGECQESRRGWEWRYLWTRVNAELTFVGHTAAVSSVAFSPDGKRIVTGSEDGTAKVWDATTGAEYFTLTGHTGLVMSVAWSPDGTRIVTGGGPWGPSKHLGDAKVWNAATGKLIRDLEGPTNCVWSVAFSPDSQRVVGGCGDWGYGPGEVHVWSAATGQETLLLPKQTNRVMGVAFSPDGRSLATCGADGKVHVWDAVTGRAVRILEYAGGVWSVAFSPESQHIIAGCSDATAKIWNAFTGTEALTLTGHTDWVRGVAFSPDGKRVVTASADHTTRVRDTVTGRQLFALKGHSGIVRSVAFSPDNRRIVTASQDKTAKVWNARAGQEIPIIKGHLDFISSIAFSPDSERIVTASGDGTAKLWDAATCQEILTFGGSTGGKWTGAAVWSVAFSPDGQRIVTGSSDKTAKVWDVGSGQVLLVLEHANAVSSVAFSPDGRRIATGSGEWAATNTGPGGARVWDSASGRALMTLNHSGVVSSVAFSSDGRRIVTAGDDRLAKVWDAATGEELLSLNGHALGLRSVMFNPDGTRIVTGSMDGTARVWEAATGEEVLRLEGHTGAVRSVVFSPDGNRIVTGSDDRSAKIWDAATGQELLALKAQPAEVWSVAFSPDGERLVTGVARERAIAKVWYAAPGPKVSE